MSLNKVRITNNWIEQSNLLLNRTIDVFHYFFEPLFKEEDNNNLGNETTIIIKQNYSSIAIIKSVSSNNNKSAILLTKEETVMILYVDKQNPTQKTSNENELTNRLDQTKEKLEIYVSQSFVPYDDFVKNKESMKELVPYIDGYWNNTIDGFQSLCFLFNTLKNMYYSNKIKENELNQLTEHQSENS